MSVLALEENFLGTGLAAYNDDSDGTGVAGVLTDNGFLTLHDHDTVLHHVHDTATPHDLARCDLVWGRLVSDRADLIARQKMHVVSHSFSSERDE